MRLLLVFCLLLSPMAAFAKAYTVDMSQSSIRFSGTHAGNLFDGVFEKWQAEIEFDEANLAASTITVTIDMASAKTGNAMYDGTLPTADWFDVKRHPHAVFTTSIIAEHNDGGYHAQGLLTIREHAVPVTFLFQLSDNGDDGVVTKFTLSVNRLDFSIGAKSDAKAEWVSDVIPLTITLSATPNTL